MHWTAPQYQDLRLIIIGDDLSAHPSVRRAMIQLQHRCLKAVVPSLARGSLPTRAVEIFIHADDLGRVRHGILR